MTMTRKRRLVASDTGVVGLAICIRVDMHFNPAAIGRLEAVLGMLRKRFVANITVGLEGLEPLGAPVLSNWLAHGLIDQSIGSGHENFVLNDLLDAAIRSTAMSSVFFDAADLLYSPARALKFIVENLGAESGVAFDAVTHFLQAGKNELLSIPRQRLSGSWRDGLRYVHVVCALGQEDFPKQSSPNLAPCHLFVSESGVKRLGGMERFRELPILLGGEPIAAYQNVSVLTTDSAADGEAFGGGRKVAAIRPTATPSESVIFDIWPAPYRFAEFASPASGCGSCVEAPRQILVGRRCPVPTDNLIRADTQQAVFIMSNFNKATYLQAALYGWVMQTHPIIRLEIVDDISTDESLAKIREFQRLTRLDASLLNVSVNEVKRGTYWIRNLVISRNLRGDAILLINDSDDVSSALRGTLQLGALLADATRNACLFNIVRVERNYAPLPLNGEVERYGTATLSFKSDLIRKAGYFQSIKKNADTEFIRRIIRFFGKASLPWVKLPVMFQPFDGSNLTADVYQINQNGSGISANLDLRKRHIEIADQHYERLSLADLPHVFDYPACALPPEYSELGEAFLMETDAITTSNN